MAPQISENFWVKKSSFLEGSKSKRSRSNSKESLYDFEDFFSKNFLSKILASKRVKFWGPFSEAKLTFAGRNFARVEIYTDLGQIRRNRYII